MDGQREFEKRRSHSSQIKARGKTGEVGWCVASCVYLVVPRVQFHGWRGAQAWRLALAVSCSLSFSLLLRPGSGEWVAAASDPGLVQVPALLVLLLDGLLRGLSHALSTDAHTQTAGSVTSAALCSFHL